MREKRNKNKTISLTYLQGGIARNTITLSNVAIFIGVQLGDDDGFLLNKNIGQSAKDRSQRLAMTAPLHIKHIRKTNRSKELDKNNLGLIQSN